MTTELKLLSLWARLCRRLLNLTRYQKRAILVLGDFAILAFVLWIALSVRYGVYYAPDRWSEAALVLAAPVITIASFGWFGLYRLVTRYIGTRGYSRILGIIWLSVLMWSLLVFMSGQLGIPRSVIFLYGLMASLAIVASRQLASYLLHSAGINIPSGKHDDERRTALIYGAGQSGARLLESLKRAGTHELVGFIDETENLWGQYIGGLRVYRPERLKGLIEKYRIDEVLLALPEVHRRQRRLLIDDLKQHPVAVKVLPAIEDIVSGKVSVMDLRPVEVVDLLGRDPVPPNAELLEREIRGKSILVTGAGGSVGSELLRQIIRQKPRRIVLLDISEAALYLIDQEIAALTDELFGLAGAAGRPEIIAVLGSVLDRALISEVIRVNEVQTIFHAAAYKHVPIVESNVIVGIANNTFGAAVVAECAKELGVGRVVFISTDKAVRPTNIMGATKRLAELVLQAEAAAGGNTIFTMVRFGNVLDSSGSVVRRFRDQIRAGGPVTVTHPDIIRYFMSIPEAAELVLQAGAMASGGEVFVLDMGDPVKIDDLARLMIRLSGLEVRDAATPHGDIEIQYTGLRPGEKLYEELLIGENTSGTEHPRILRSTEPFLSKAVLQRELDQLSSAMQARDMDEIQSILLRTVEGFRPDDARPDLTRTAPEPWVSVGRTLH